MGKKTKSDDTPFVSVCTPTFNRRPFIPIMFECFRNQDYKKSRIEWIIVDDGTDTIEDLVEKSGIQQIKYFKVNEKMSLGKKRNYMHSLISSKSKFIIYQDDDDYYPPERISHAVEMLTKFPKALCAGSSEIYIYFKHIHAMYQMGPYNPHHATAGTFAFRRELLDVSKYNDEAELAEEREFLKGYTVPFIQLNPLKTILVFSHIHNTFDKKKLLQNPDPRICKISNKTVDTFIRLKKEEKIKKFFLEEIDGLLSKYEPGTTTNKPKMLKQLKEMEEQRKVAQKPVATSCSPLTGNVGSQEMMFSTNGEPPQILTLEKAVQLLQTQNNRIQYFMQRTATLEEQYLLLQNQMVDLLSTGSTYH
jgi:glycosyltransferase involved in cell wall biosynthesis